MELDLTQASVAQISEFYLPTPNSYVRANMVMSQDGFFIDENGSSRGLTSPLDLKVLLTIRAISDAVLVGAQTVRLENYKTPILAGEYLGLNTKNPRLVVISKNLNFDLSTRLFENTNNKPIIITPLSQDAKWLESISDLNEIAEVHVLPVPLDFKLVLEVLSQMGLTKIVCEGGPQLLAELLNQNLVDELDITKSRAVVGDQKSTNLSDNQVINAAITAWPNRVSAKLGDQQLLRIKR
jgi:riboflavin biosynthesis pyrimidine reductase